MLKLYASIGLALAVLLEAVLLYLLIAIDGPSVGTVPWLVVHVLMCIIASVCACWFIVDLTNKDARKVVAFTFAVSLSIPFVGILGVLVSLTYGLHQANKRHVEDVYWQFTKNADLPFTAPVGRSPGRVDGRGFVEQLQYSGNADDLYKKVLAARNIRNSLSVSALKEAISHSDDRIRLTAYQILDTKVTDLNREIQNLEKSAALQNKQDGSNTWLQIASNYWELLTIEKDEPVARKQLLQKAYEAAITAVKILPTNRNAHFTLGRIALLQNNERVASVAFDRAMALGMPTEKAMPYRAEAAFLKKDFKMVSSCIAQIDDAFKDYPPLCHLADYWK